MTLVCVDSLYTEPPAVSPAALLPPARTLVVRTTEVGMDLHIPFSQGGMWWCGDTTASVVQALRKASDTVVGSLRRHVSSSSPGAEPSSRHCWDCHVALAVPSAPMKSSGFVLTMDRALVASAVRECEDQIQRHGTVMKPARVDLVPGGLASLDDEEDDTEPKWGRCTAIVQLSLYEITDRAPETVSTTAPTSMLRSLAMVSASRLVSDQSSTDSSTMQGSSRVETKSPHASRNERTTAASLLQSASSMELLAMVSTEIHERTQLQDVSLEEGSGSCRDRTVARRCSDSSLSEDESSSDHAASECEQVTSAAMHEPAVRHRYRDFADTTPRVDEMVWTRASTHSCPPNAPFPLKLHITLEAMERDGLAHIMSWLPHGRSFKIHDTPLFIQLVLPKVRIVP
jgi:hypothetical protein